MNEQTRRIKSEYDRIHQEYLDYFNRRRKENTSTPDMELYTLEDDLSNGILFVGMNPSGTDKDHYNNKSQHNGKRKEDVYVYEDIDTPYFKAIEKLLAEIKKGEIIKDVNSSVLDLFSVVEKKQNVLQDEYLDIKNERLYNAMIDIFFMTILRLRPKVIVVINAFVGRCFKGTQSSEAPSPDGRFKDWIKLTSSEEFGGYDITITKPENVEGEKELVPLTTHVFFSSMLSGSRALDCGSRENLAWLVRNYLRN
ncbi:MAG: hypothetical protein IJQ60_13775 [Prevotella sp.]|nr:hypothetical protein [Prevotella sp.]